MTNLQCQLEGCRTTKDGGWIVQFACGQDQVGEVSHISSLRDESLYVVVMTENEYQQYQSGTGG